MRTGLILWLIGTIFTAGFLATSDYEERDWEGITRGQAALLACWTVAISIAAWPYLLGSRLGERLRKVDANPPTKDVP